MNLQERIKAFDQVGKHLSNFINADDQDLIEDKNGISYFQLLSTAVERAYQHNAWFTKPNVFYSLQGWSELLSGSLLSEWMGGYSLKPSEPKTIAIVMAGNIPLVGFHDFLSVLLTGHKALIKESSNDNVLLKTICSLLLEIEPRFSDFIIFSEAQLTGFDAVIATGSNNTARYFEYYFGKHPNIIRKNRNSIAVLKGDESSDQLEALSDDIFRYYGLGCRNVSKIYVPEGYNFDLFFNAIYKWHPIIHEQKYANNYDYNKAVYLMSEYEMLDNGFMILKEDIALTSPIATLNYEFYTDENALRKQLNGLSEDVQCIVADGFTDREVKFGNTQRPDLWSYADNVDTVEFLLTI